MLSLGLVQAGDAVVIGYNAAGIWTAVTYYCSSTPKGERDYKDKSEARKEAVRDLKHRGGQQIVRWSVLAESDATRFVAVARGKVRGDTDLTVVGSGQSQREADEKAVAELNRAGATAEQKIVYRYFTYGADSQAKP